MHSIYQTPSIHRLSRFLGTPLSRLPSKYKVDFFSLLPQIYDSTPDKTWSPQLEAAFFVCCLACTLIRKNDNRPCKIDDDDYEDPENILQEMYNDRNASDAIKKDIHYILSTNLTEDARMLVRLGRIFTIAANTYPSKMKKISLYCLFDDLSKWNNTSIGSPRWQWGKKIMDPIAKEYKKKKEKAAAAENAVNQPTISDN